MFCCCCYPSYVVYSPLPAAVYIGNASHTSLQYSKHRLAQENAQGCSAHITAPVTVIAKPLRPEFSFSLFFFIAVIAVPGVGRVARGV